MSKYKTLVAGLGALAGLGVMIVPAGVMALTECEEGETCSESASVNAVVTLNDVISMRIVSYSDGETTTSDCVSDTSVAGYTCTGDSQVATTSLLPNSTNVTDNTSSAYSQIYVSTNSRSGYILTLIDTDEVINLTSGNNTIQAIDTKPAVGTPGWAVYANGSWQIMKRNKNAAGTTAAETPITVKTGTPTASANIVNDLSTVYYGYATSSTQPAGTYTDSILYTATVQ